MYQLHHLGKAATDADCYIFQLALAHSNDVIAASNSGNTIKLYSRDNLQFIGECAKLHQATIHDLCWSPSIPTCILSCDAVGMVCLSDARQGQSAVVDLPLQHRDSLYSFDLRSCGNILAAGDGTDTVLYDMRTAKKELRRIGEFHTDDITQVRFHPLHPDVLCTASEDGLLNVLDLTKEDDDDDLLRWVFNIENPVTRISFWGPRREKVAAITTLEGVGLASLDTGDVFALLPRQTDDTYVIDCAYGKAYGSDELLVFTGNKEEAFLGSIAVQVAQPATLSPPIALLTGGHTDLVRCALCLDDGQAIVTGGEDSVLCMWKPGPPAVAPTRAIRATPASGGRGGGGRGGGKGGRPQKFTPY